MPRFIQKEWYVIMWYVIQTMVGYEEKIREQIDSKISKDICSECFTIKYENIWKKSGSSNVCVEMLFPGYIFIDTENPEQLYDALKMVEGFSSLLSDKNDKVQTFLQIEREEQELLENIMNEDPEHIVRVSYVHRNSDKRIDYAKGPLRYYVDKIVSVDYHHRRVFIEVPFLNSIRRIKLAMVVDEDIEQEKEIIAKEEKELPNIDKWDWKTRKAYNDNHKEEAVTENTVNGIKAGDLVVDDTQTYGDRVMKVKRIIPKKNVVIVEVKMFRTIVELEIDADSVSKVVGRKSI